MLLVLFNPYIGPYQVLPLRARVNLGAMAMKGYSTIPKAPSTAVTSVTLRPHPHHIRSVSSTISLLSRPVIKLVAEGVTHISLLLQEYDRGGNRRTTNKHEQKLGVNQEQKEVLQHFISVCGLSLAWVTSENSTSNSNADILSRSSSLDPILSPLLSPESGVDCPSPWFPANSFCCPAANCLSAPFSSQLSFASPYHFRIRRDFRSKNPLFFSRQNRQRNRLLWRATHIVLHLTIRLFSVICRTLFRGVTPSAEVQSVYSTAPADWATKYLVPSHNLVVYYEHSISNKSTQIKKNWITRY